MLRHMSRSTLISFISCSTVSILLHPDYECYPHDTASHCAVSVWKLEVHDLGMRQGFAYDIIGNVYGYLCIYLQVLYKCVSCDLLRIKRMYTLICKLILSAMFHNSTYVRVMCHIIHSLSHTFVVSRGYWNELGIPLGSGHKITPP